MSNPGDDYRDGRLRPSVPPHLRFLFGLPFQDKGGEQGLWTLCLAIPGLELPRHPTKVLCVEKLYAYYKTDGDEDAKLAAAADITPQTTAVSITQMQY